MGMQHLKGELVLLITAIIWGFAFVFQSTAADLIGAFTFNAFRFLLGALSILPLLRFNRHGMDIKKCIRSGILLGIMIFLGSTAQQIGIAYTTSGKAGFISSLYMIFVPILGFILFRHKTNKNVVIALILALFGLYLINGGSFVFEMSDLIIILSAVFFALHIIFVDRFAKDVNSVMLSFVQYLTGGIIALILALIFDDMQLNMIIKSMPSVLYTGILSTGVAYTLQIIGQKNTEPAIASLILSLESVVSVIGGYLLLNETLTPIEMIGCIFMFIGVMIAQRRDKNARSSD